MSPDPLVAEANGGREADCTIILSIVLFQRLQHLRILLDSVPKSIGSRARELKKADWAIIL